MYSYSRVEVSCKIVFEERTRNIIVSKFASFLLNLRIDFNNDIDFAFADINCSLGFRYTKMAHLCASIMKKSLII